MRRRPVLLFTALVIGGVSVASAGALTPSGSAAKPRAEKSTTTTLDKNAKSFDIQSTRGSISITSGSTASVVSNASYTLTEPKVVVTTTNGVVKITIDCSGILGTVTNALLPNDCRTNLVVTLPAAATVHASTDAGALTVNKMAGELKLFTQTGPLSLTGSSGKAMALTTGTGQMVVDTVSTPSFRAASNTGPITIKKALTQKFTVASSGGTIRAENSTLGDIVAQNDSAALSFTAVSAATAAFVSGAGNITVHKIGASSITASSQTGVVDISTTNAIPSLTMQTKSSTIVAAIPKNVIYKISATSKTGKATINKLVQSPKATRVITANSDTGNITINGY